MKLVLISIQPKWCELIASGKKTVEVRKTRPKIEAPFKVYIYMTKDKWYKDYKNKNHYGNGKVIGEFVCDDINTTDVVHGDEEVGWYVNNMHAVKGSCLDEYDILNYCPKEATIYGWHISDLVIYDKPKELSEFYKRCYSGCEKCKYESWDYDLGGGKDIICTVSNKKPIKRPPQSWCYVEEGR